MTPTRLAGVVVFVVAAVGALGAQPAKPGAKPEQELIQIENDWCAADIKQDLAALGKILSADYTGVGSRGGVETRESSIASYKDKSITTTSCVNSNMKARVYGDAAVVTGTVTRAGSYKGAAFKDRQLLYTDTFVRRDGRWQCVASQATVVAAQQK